LFGYVEKAGQLNTFHPPGDVDQPSYLCTGIARLIYEPSGLEPLGMTGDVDQAGKLGAMCVPFNLVKHTGYLHALCCATYMIRNARYDCTVGIPFYHGGGPSYQEGVFSLRNATN